MSSHPNEIISCSFLLMDTDSDMVSATDLECVPNDPPLTLRLPIASAFSAHWQLELQLEVSPGPATGNPAHPSCRPCCCSASALQRCLPHTVCQPLSATNRAAKGSAHRQRLHSKFLCWAIRCPTKGPSKKNSLELSGYFP